MRQAGALDDAAQEAMQHVRSDLCIESQLHMPAHLQESLRIA